MAELWRVVRHLPGRIFRVHRADRAEFFFITLLADPTMVAALDFAAFDAFPNAITKVLTLGTDLWFAGAARLGNLV